MSDLFDHIKNELDREVHHEIDESVWAAVEQKLDKSPMNILIPWWLSAVGAFIAGLLLSYIWVNNGSKGVSPIASKLAEGTGYIDTIYIRDTVIVGQSNISDFLPIRHQNQVAEAATEGLENSSNNLSEAQQYAIGFINGLLSGSPNYRVDPIENSAIQSSKLTTISRIEIAKFSTNMEVPQLLSRVAPNPKLHKRPFRMSIGLVSNFFDRGLQTEKYLHEYKSYGARLVFNPHHRLNITGGVEMRHYRGGYDETLPETLFVPSAIEKRSDIIDFYYKTSFVDIPVIVNYHFNTYQRLIPYVGVGLKLSKITAFGADYLLNDGSELERTVDISQSSFFFNSVLMNVGSSYQSSLGVGAFAELYYRYQMNLSMLEFEKNHGVGLKIGVFYSF